MKKGQFQSLFYWKYHSKFSMLLNSVYGISSFNPYFIGSTIARQIELVIDCPVEKRFNPYFIGSTIASLLVLR